MYSSFYGFTEKPFDVTPDPKFLYLNGGRKEPLAALLYGIMHRRGFVVIVGEVGTGKTTLINSVLGRLDEKTKVAYIFDTDMSFGELLIMILVELGLTRASEKITKVQALTLLNNFAIRQFAKGGNVAIVIDEAQNLNQRSMENLRLLSNLETRKQKLIQIVLSGQPELDEKLNRPELRQLKQRISLKRYIVPLDEKETYEYIEHRLKIANYKSGSLFNRKARKLIWKYSGGIPRKINILCDNALLVGFALQKRKITENIIDEVVRDLSYSPFSQRTDSDGNRSEKNSSGPKKNFFVRPGFAVTSAFLILLCLLFVAMRYFFPSWSDMIDIRSVGSRAEISEAIVRKPVPAPSNLAIINEPSIADEQKETKGGGFLFESESENTGYEAGPNSIDAKIDAFASDRDVSENNSPLRIDEPGRVVVAKQGDCLSKLIIEAYGGFDQDKLNAFLRENPQIQNPDLLRVGQALIFPTSLDRN